MHCYVFQRLSDRCHFVGYDQSPQDDDKLPDDEAKDQFDRLVGSLVNTPPKPHAVKDSQSESNEAGKGDGSLGKVRRRPS